MLKHMLAGCLVGLMVAIATWSFLPAHEAQAAPETPKRGLTDKAYCGFTYTKNKDDTLKITHVYPATPAWDAGLMREDTIMGVECFVEGKKTDEPAPPMYLLLGLTNAAPGTEFRIKVLRGDPSLAAEKAICKEFVEKQIDIPAARSLFEHFRKAMKDWNRREMVWINIKSCSFKEFSDFHMREQQVELVRTQILEIQTRMQLEEAEIKQAYQNIRTLIAQEDLARAQAEVARVQQMESGFGIAKTILSIALMFFGL
ncbi:hypothetical protein ARNL5_01053 [Anaerolineae bacterium]|nr:hypothetical protein ARNL5_01053 [Anaerolineae bacterium]